MAVAAIPVVGLVLVLIWAFRPAAAQSTSREQYAAPAAFMPDSGGEVIRARLGDNITLGAFAKAAAGNYGGINLAIQGQAVPENYARYRAAVRKAYGADLADMNYFSAGTPGWERNIPGLRKWLLSAARYGDPVLALEPLGKIGYGVFTDSPGMRQLRDVFLELQKNGSDVRVRFASEANLAGNPYSATKTDAATREFRRSARWFREYMPDNVKMVFSPLINTPVLETIKHGRREAIGPMRKMMAMYEPGVYDYIGGTIYADPRFSLRELYDFYLYWMRTLDEDTPLQIDELGAPIGLKDDLCSFIEFISKGGVPELKTVMFFDGAVNPRRERQYGPHGTVASDTGESYTRQYITTWPVEPNVKHP